jgi:hypothetical protein
VESRVEGHNVVQQLELDVGEKVPEAQSLERVHRIEAAAASSHSLPEVVVSAEKESVGTHLPAKRKARPCAWLLSWYCWSRLLLLFFQQPEVGANEQ